MSIIRKGRYSRYLVSREFDQQLERESRKFAAEFPHARPIIVFRRHDSYIGSQYRRFVKNGFRGRFTDFFDVENDARYFKKQDLNFRSQVTLLENLFYHKPLVFFYEDLKAKPLEFIQKITDQLNVAVNISELNLETKHSSYSLKQLRGMQAFGKVMDLRKRRIYNNSLLHFLWRMYLGGIRYSVLFVSRLLPSSFYTDSPLIKPEELEAIRQYYQNDWQACLEYAQRQA
ncbi:MAG: hypothetical protein U5L96_13600 [Owenweeksia sp.]|nr:hypothetical protein [Owenweeksia sp.]